MARLKAIKMLLTFASFKIFKPFQVNVKNAFLNNFIEEMYVEQAPHFENPDVLDHVFKLDKTLYGLKQASRA